MLFNQLRLCFVCLASCSLLYALPQYTAREGRICDSCHAYPFETEKQKAWQDPPLAERKCNLSCLACHVDPGGGGIRAVAGRYLANASLPIFNNEIRPWHDQNRNISDLIAWLRPKPKSEPTKLAAQAMQKAKRKPAMPDTRPAKFHTHELPPNYTLRDPMVFGTAPQRLDNTGKPQGRTYAPEFGIYGNLNADPLLQLGGDLRVAYVKTDNKSVFFPMQFDVGARVHPVEHLTFAGTLGLVGQATPSARERKLADMYTVRNAYLMLHELPYQIYLRGGIFQPSFGVRQEDHTAPVRQYFEMDLSRKYSGVLGAEAGFAANYPFLNVSVFSNNVGRPPGDTNQEFVINPQGFGTAVNGGWRDLLWGVGSSLMHKQRPRIYGGQFDAISFDFYLNFGRIWLNFPLTLLGEYAFGRSTTTGTRNFSANFIELNYLLLNGINLKANHHFYDFDLTSRGNESGRIGLGVELIPLTIMKLYFEYRVPWRVNAAQIKSDGIVNPFDWLLAEQFIFIGHVFF